MKSDALACPEVDQEPAPRFWRIVRRVTENRGLLAAISVALLTIGGGGYISLKVATALLARKVDVRFEIHSCLVVTGVAVVMIVALLGIGIHLWWVRRKIAHFTSQAISLMEDTRNNTTNSDGEMTAIEKRYIAWVKGTESWLKWHERASEITTQAQDVVGSARPC